MDRLHRLTSSRDFSLAARAGTRASAGFLSIAVLTNDADRPTRFGFTTPRSVGSAVRRNRVKRLMREAARAIAVPPGADVVVTAKAGAYGSSFQEVRAALQQALSKAGVAC